MQNLTTALSGSLACKLARVGSLSLIRASVPYTVTLNNTHWKTIKAIGRQSAHPFVLIIPPRAVSIKAGQTPGHIWHYIFNATTTGSAKTHHRLFTACVLAPLHILWHIIIFQPSPSSLPLPPSFSHTSSPPLPLLSPPPFLHPPFSLLRCFFLSSGMKKG